MDEPGLLARLAATAGVDEDAYYASLMRVSGCKDATRADYLVLCHVANKYQLDPLLKQVGLMETKHGPRVYVGIDGWVKKLLEHEDYLMHRREDVWSGGQPGKGTIEAVTVFIYRKSWVAQGLPPFAHPEYLRECRRDTGPWSSHPSRMLYERALGQAIRFCFGMYVPEADEYGKMDDMMEARGEVPAAAPTTALAPAIPIQVSSHPAATARVEVSEAVARESIEIKPAPAPEPVPARKAQARKGEALPEFDPAESLKVDQMIANQQGSMFDDDINFE